MYDSSYEPPSDLLCGRVVLVTGAGDGIGRAVAVACARFGATVVLLGKTVRKLEAVYDQIVDTAACEPAIYPMDLLGANADDFEVLADKLEAEFGRLDGLVNNAALLGVLSPIEHYDLESWAKVMQVNVNAVFLLTRACLPRLRAAQDASIIFTSCAVGRKGKAYWGAYAVSKFATEGLMQVLADEVSGSERLRVNCINPGVVRTRMRAVAYPAENPQQLTPPGQIVTPYLYLLGADSAGVNGHSLDAQ